MAGDLPHGEGKAGRLEPLSVVHQPIRIGAPDCHSHRGAHVRLGVAEQVRLVAADHQGSVGERRLHGLVTGDMVHVAVSIQDGRGLQPFSAQQVEDRLRVEARIDHESRRSVPAARSHN